MKHCLLTQLQSSQQLTNYICFQNSQDEILVLLQLPDGKNSNFEKYKIDAIKLY